MQPILVILQRTMLIPRRVVLFPENSPAIYGWEKGFFAFQSR